MIFFFFVLVKSYSISPVRLQCVHREKSYVTAFFKVCIDHLFDNLESGKRNYCFGKKSLEKVLNFGLQNLHEPCLRFLNVRDYRLKQVLKPLKLACENNWHFATPTLSGFPAKWSLRNERRNSILMTCHYSVLGYCGSVSDWLCHKGNLLKPIRTTLNLSSNSDWLKICFNQLEALSRSG